MAWARTIRKSIWTSIRPTGWSGGTAHGGWRRRRSATLAAAGTLDLARPVASPARELKVTELPNNGPLARRLGEQALASTHRSVYRPLLRGLPPTSLEVFDFAEQGMVTGQRDTTSVATQALYLLNDPFVRRESLALAERLLRRTGSDDAGRVDWVYRLTLGRPASAVEIERAERYLASYESALRQVIVATQVESRPRPGASVALATADTTGKDAPRKPAPPQNPDEVEQIESPVEEQQVIAPADPRTAAWASFCQALLGIAEFRYIG